MEFVYQCKREAEYVGKIDDKVAVIYQTMRQKIDHAAHGTDGQGSQQSITAAPALQHGECGSPEGELQGDKHDQAQNTQADPVVQDYIVGMR